MYNDLSSQLLIYFGKLQGIIAQKKGLFQAKLDRALQMFSLLSVNGHFCSNVAVALLSAKTVTSG